MNSISPDACGHQHLLTEPQRDRGERSRGLKTCKVLGIHFHAGSIDHAIRELCATGGLLVAPAAPGLVKLLDDCDYRQALLDSDIVLPDSGLMILIGRARMGIHLNRISGLGYLRELVRYPQFRVPEATLWVMASKRSAQKNIEWLAKCGIEVSQDRVYLAPSYGGEVMDQDLLDILEKHPVKHVVLTLGGGVQEPLGRYLKRELSYGPAIHCIGAAIAMLSGDQFRVPRWADSLYLGWSLRCASHPFRYIPRYFHALRLVPLILRYADQLPPLGKRRRGASNPALLHPPGEMQIP